jgi:hypothetical protein
MRTIHLGLLALLALSLAGCFPSHPRDAILGRWESHSHPGLGAEFTEDETVRIWGDFGQAVGRYTVEDDGSVRIHLHRHGESELPGCLTACVSRNTLTLRAGDRGRVKLRRM